MSVRPFTPDAAIAAAVTKAHATSTLTGAKLYELIADTVETEVTASTTIDNKTLIPEIVFNVGNLIHDEHTSAATVTQLTKAIKNTNMIDLATDTATQVFRIYNAGPTSYTTDDELIEASTNAFAVFSYSPTIDGLTLST